MPRQKIFHLYDFITLLVALLECNFHSLAQFKNHFTVVACRWSRVVILPPLILIINFMQCKIYNTSSCAISMH